MKYFKKAIILIFLISLFGCLPIPFMSLSKAMLHERGTVLKEYQEGNDYIMIAKEGDSIIKYRLYQYDGLGKATRSEAMYVIDTANQRCFSGVGKTIGKVIDCDSVKRDSDLAQYITWGPQGAETEQKHQENNKNIDGYDIISNTFIGTQENNKLNGNAEQFTEQRSKPEPQIELSEQLRREIYKEMHYAKDRAWSEMPSDTSKRKELREKYKQKVMQKYNITKEVYKIITVEGARNSWYVPPFSYDKIQK